LLLALAKILARLRADVTDPRVPVLATRAGLVQIALFKVVLTDALVREPA